jgi:hypothetical protein
LPKVPLLIYLIFLAPVSFTFKVILPSAPELVTLNFTLTVTPGCKTKEVVTGEIVATLATVPAAVEHSAYQVD